MSLPWDLLARSRDRNVVPFAGAGVSMAVRGKDGSPLFPSWKELLLSGAHRLQSERRENEAAIVKGMVEGNRFPEAAEELKLGLGGLFFEWLRDELVRDSATVDENSLKLAESLWNIGSPLILTSNYDRVLRWACPFMKDLEEWTGTPPLNPSKVKMPTLWQVHGSVGDPGSILLTQSDYRARYTGETDDAVRYLQNLRPLLRDKTLLFLGFSFNDIYLQGEIALLNYYFPSEGPTHYLFIPEERGEITEKSLKNLRTNIAVIKYAGHGELLLEILDELRAAAGPRKLSEVPPVSPPNSGSTREETMLDKTPGPRPPYRFDDPEKAYAEALRLIADVAQSGNDTLNLNGFGLIDIPPEIDHLSHLKCLNLSNNRLAALPDLWSMSKLRILSANYNRIMTLPSEIGRLAALEELWLDDNSLRTLPPEVGQLTSLKILWIANNRLRFLTSSIRSLSGLELLNIDNNRLEELPVEIGCLAALRELWLNDNLLTTLPAQIGSMSSLKVLWLNENWLTCLPREIGKLSEMQALWLRRNELTELPAEVGQLTNLERAAYLGNPRSGLHIEQNPFSDDKLKIQHAQPAATSVILFYLRTREQTLPNLGASG